MASTYSNLKIQLMTTGENNTTWGNVTNVNLGTAVEEAITGSADVTFASADVTLTLTNTNTTQTARNLRLNLTGTTGGARNLIVPSIEKVYIVNNGCADAVTVKNSTGTGIAVPAGKTMWVFNDATNVLDAVTYLTSLTLGAALPVASGGTGSNTGDASSLTNINVSSATGTLSVSHGGTGATTLTGYVYGTGTGALAASTTISTSNLSGSVAIANGGTGATTAAGALSNLGAYPSSNPSGFVTSSGSVAYATSAGSASSATNATNATYATYATNASGDFYAAGTIRAAGNVVAYYSDDRLKTRLGYISGALAKVMSLKGFYYEANEVAKQLGYEPVREVGLSAQDVQAVMPETIHPAPIDPQYLTLDYARLVPLLVEAIKEQQILIDALSKKVNG